MSRRASRSSFSGSDQSELVLECKAAYLSVFNSIDEKIRRKDDLIEVLQQAGRNPSSNAIKKHWSSKTDYLTFDDFVDICRKEPETSEDDMMKAFRKIDINGDGYLSLDELYKIMSTKGDKMTRDEVKKMIDEVDENGDGRLDYKEFCQMVTATTKECKKISLKIMEKKEKKKKKEQQNYVETSLRKEESNLGSQISMKSSSSFRSSSAKMGSQQSLQSRDETSEKKTGSMISVRSDSANKKDDSTGMFGSRRSMLSIDDLPRPSPRSKKDRPRGGAAAKLDRLPEPRNLKSWTHKSIKGCFFLEDDSIVNHHYELTLEDDSEIWITIQPISTKSIASEDIVVDTALYIVRKDARDDGSYVAFTELRDSKGKYGKKCKLDAGDYCIYPMTTGCHLKPRTREPKREVDIIKKDKDDNVVLTKAFKKALDDIFEMCDLDDNGSISREEFGWFNKRTSDETVTDEEWQVVEEKIDLNNDKEITRQGFIQLHQMEAEDEGDPEDLWLTMTNFGFNKELVMDEACPFKIDVYADECEDIEIKVSDIENISDKLAPLIQQSAIDKGECTKIKGMKDLFLYTYINDGRATIVVDNKSYSKVKVDLDCSSSKNCLSNTGSLHNTITVRANTQEIGLHLVPADESYDWTVRCSESILK